MWILVGTITAPCTRSLPWYFLLHISKINSAQTHMLVCGQQRRSITYILFVCTTLHLHAAKWIDRNCKLLKRCQQNRFKTVSRCPWMFLGTSRDLQGLNGTRRRCIAAAASCTDYHLWVILCKILHTSKGFEVELCISRVSTVINKSNSWNNLEFFQHLLFSGFGFSASGVTWGKSMTALW